MLQIQRLSLLSLASACLYAQSVPPDVPAKYTAIYQNLENQIGAFQSAVDADWNGQPYPVLWAPHLTTAESSQYTQLLSSNPLGSYYDTTVLVQLQELQAGGATAVTIHIDFPILYEPFYQFAGGTDYYLQFVAFYQRLVKDVHARGMQLSWNRRRKKR